MVLAISVRLAFHLEAPTDLLMQFEAAAIPGQRVLASTTALPGSRHHARVTAQDGVGERLWLKVEGDCTLGYQAKVEVERETPDLATLAAVPLHGLPGEVAKYLFDSRYCQVDPMHAFITEQFGALEGGAKVLAMRDWIAEHFVYEPGASNAHTTALDSYVERRGICCDYAHVLMTFARASMIPARYASCYSPGVSPPDFHAVAEVFLADPRGGGGGAWQIVDATGMADPAQTAIIGVGRDAADVSFLTSFGAVRFDSSEVRVTAE